MRFVAHWMSTVSIAKSTSLLPIVNFRTYKAFDNVAIREFYSLLRDTILGAKNVGLLKVLFAEQSLTTIMGRVPGADWKQWDMDRPNWMQGTVEPAFKEYAKQK